MFVPLPGAQEAVRCTPGTHQRLEGMTSCEPCAAGEHQSEPGAAVCIPCQTGTDSAAGSSECTICAIGFYKPQPGSLAADCISCTGVRGTTCGSNATMANLNLTYGHWRHSSATVQTWRCKASGGWSPCDGGIDAGRDGDSYCAAGYHGPRCELCDTRTDNASKYFDEWEARCYSCSDVTTHAISVVSALGFLVLVAGSGSVALVRLKACAKLREAFSRGMRNAYRVWSKGGMRYKLKVLIGMYQCIAAVPSVYNMDPPPGVEVYTGWLRLLELPANLENILIPTACLGRYRTRLLLGSTWPIVLVLLMSTCFMSWELAQEFNPTSTRALRLQRSQSGLQQALSTSSSARVCNAVRRGLQATLQFTLVLTFVLVPSTTMRIFRTFLCDPIEYNAAVGTTYRYLHDDLALGCDSPQYQSTRSIAFALMCVWPVGTPVLYAVLLWVSRHAIRHHAPTPLSRATAFLYGDYAQHAFWYEPVDLCRKLTVTVQWWPLEFVQQPNVNASALHHVTVVSHRCRVGSSYYPTSNSWLESSWPFS